MVSFQPLGIFKFANCSIADTNLKHSSYFSCNYYLLFMFVFNSQNDCSLIFQDEYCR